MCVYCVQKMLSEINVHIRMVSLYIISKCVRMHEMGSLCMSVCVCMGACVSTHICVIGMLSRGCDSSGMSTANLQNMTMLYTG